MRELLGTMYRRRAVGLNYAVTLETGIPYNVLTERIVRGMTLQEAVDLYDEEEHRTWGFTHRDGSRIEHRALVRRAISHHVSVVQIIDELEVGYEENLALEQAVGRAEKRPWPLPPTGSQAHDAMLVGLHQATFSRRLDRGMPYQEALEKPARIRESFRVTLSVGDLATELGTDEGYVCSRIEGMEAERKKGHYAAGIMNELLGLDVIPSDPFAPDELGRFTNPGEPMWDGKVNIAALARHAGLSPATLRSRLHNGWDLQEALLTPPGLQGAGARRTLKGPVEEWPMHRKEAQRAQQERAGLSARIVWKRIRDGWDPDAALTAPKGARRKHAVNISELARKHGLGPETVRARMKKGWTLEEALNTPPRQPRPSAVVDSAHGTQSEDTGP